MKKLISMTDFVIDRFNERNEDYDILVYNYANFLKQPLELWMFVPCDKNWNVLKEPEWMHRYNNGASPFMNVDEIIHCQDYKKAKERCLFDGFELKGETEFSWIFKHNVIFPIMISKQRNIEYLVTILKREIELTQTAIKQI